MNPKVSIIILNWNGWKDTIECLESFYQITYPDYDVIVVDNGSENDSVEKMKEYAEGKIKVESKFFEYDRSNKPIKYIEYTREAAEAGGGDEDEIADLSSNRKMILIKNEKNYGFAEGANIGMRYALNVLNPDYILFLNNDTVVDKGVLDELVSVSEKDERVGAVGPKVISPDGSIQRACTRRLPTFLDFIFVYSFIGEKLLKENMFWRRHFNYDYNFDRLKEVEVLSGSCMLLKRIAIDDIGLLDESTFLSWEESIIGVKLKKKGWKSMVNPKLEIIHLGGETVKTLNLKSWARYWSKRSEFYFLKKYLGMRKFKRALISIVLLIEAFSALLLAIVERNKGDFDVKNELKTIKFLMNELF